jgi:hypothetical protein
MILTKLEGFVAHLRAAYGSTVTLKLVGWLKVTSALLILLLADALSVDVEQPIVLNIFRQIR